VTFAQHPVFVSLAPVFLLIAAGVVAGRRQWIRGEAVRDLSNLVFLLLIPALLFRTMSSVRLETLDWRPVLAYFLAAGALLAVSIAWRGFNSESVVLGLAGVFSNMVMIGITLVGLAYGQQGLVTLLTLVSVHALTLLTAAYVVLELAQAREVRAQGGVAPNVMATAWSALKGAFIHPVPLPIVCGLAFAQTGWVLPDVVDKPLQLLGSAFGPLALVLVGVSLARTPMRGHLPIALWITLSKNLLLPALVAVSAWTFGIGGLPFTVMVVTAALPIGANVFLFAQRYRVVEEGITAAMGVSTVAALVTLSLVMLLLA
jgi:malonate transporter and related proteins